jgi:hypothetical protein
MVQFVQELVPGRAVIVVLGEHTECPPGIIGNLVSTRQASPPSSLKSRMALSHEAARAMISSVGGNKKPAMKAGSYILGSGSA